MKMKLLAAIFPVLLLVACSKVTVENYDRLKTGMPYEEVKLILGSPDRCSEVLGLKSCIWGSESRHINVNFISDLAVIFAAENIR